MAIKSNNQQGNPYHDEEGKFTSGNNASTSKSTEDKLNDMGFGPGKTKYIVNKKKPEYRHEIDANKSVNDEEWETFENEEEFRKAHPEHKDSLEEEKLSKMGFGPDKKVREKDYTIAYAGHDPEGNDDFEIDVGEDAAIDYIIDAAVNDKFANEYKEFHDWVNDTFDKNPDVDIEQAFRNSPFYDEADIIFDKLVNKIDKKLRDQIAINENDRYEEYREGGDY